MNSISMNSPNKSCPAPPKSSIGEETLCLEKREFCGLGVSAFEKEDYKTLETNFSLKKNKSAMYNPFNSLTETQEKSCEGSRLGALDSRDPPALKPVFTSSAHLMSFGFKRVSLSKFKNCLIPLNPLKTPTFRNV